MNLEFKKQRNEMIAASILRTATHLKELAARLPRNGKAGNILRKSYNRRPRSKEMRMVIGMKLWLAANIGARNIAMMLSQPIPKKDVVKSAMIRERAIVGEFEPAIMGVPEHITAMGRIGHAVGNIEWGYPMREKEPGDLSKQFSFDVRQPIQIKPLEYPFFAHD